MRGDFSRDSFDERKHYTQVLLQQSRVQLDADWNEAAAIATRRDERVLQNVIGACGSPNEGFRIAARQTLDSMESTADWSVAGTGAELCVDYIDRLRGTASLRVAKATEVRKSLPVALDLSGADDLLTFAVKSANPLSGAQYDTGFTFFVADAENRQASWAVAALAPVTMGLWRLYSCPLAAATKDPGLQLGDVRTFGFMNLKTDWTYHFDLIQRDFAPLAVPLQDILALDDIEAMHGWSVPAGSTGSVGLDAGTLFRGRPTVKITGPAEGRKSFGEARDLRAYRRIITVTNQTSDPSFFLQCNTGAKITLQNLTSTTAAGWTTYVGDIPAAPNLHQIVGYGFEVATGASLNVAQVLAVLNSTGNFYILGGAPGQPGRMYVDGIPCQKETTETYYSQVSYPEALPLDPAENRVDLVYLDVWQRHVTSIEDPELREVALGGPDTCTRVQTVAQVKVLHGTADVLDTRLDCASIPTGLKDTFQKLLATGRGTLSTLTAVPSPPDNLCEIAPDADFLGLNNRLYRVEIHAPGAVGEATFKWSRHNGAIAVAIVEDVVPATGSNPQVVRVQRLGRDRDTSLAVNDWVEISDDLTDLGDESYDSQGLPRHRMGELRQVKAPVDPDANTITLSASLAHSYTVMRHAKVRKWDGAGALTAAFVGTQTTPQLDLGDGVRITFDGGTESMRTGDYWQFTARSATGQIEKLDRTLPAGVVHHFCPLALIKWKANGAGGYEIADLADCWYHFPALTEMQATDVAYDDSCCGLTDDVKTLAASRSDPLDPQFKVANVQQALDALCAREQEFLVLRYVGGDGQEGQPDAVLPAELVVAVENVLGEPAAGVPVSFAVFPIGGDVTSSGSVSAATINTNPNGEARVRWRLGPQQGLNLVRASLNTPQAGQPQVIFNARAVVPARGCLCTITVGDGIISHGQFNGADGLRHALEIARDQDGGTVCVLRGRYILDEPIDLSDGAKIIVQGNRLETILVARRGIAFRFTNMQGIELHDLIVQAELPRNSSIEGVVGFWQCRGAVVDACWFIARGDEMDRVVGLLIADTPLAARSPFRPPLVRDCLVHATGVGQFLGMALRHSAEVVVANNRIQVLVEGGGVGIDLEDCDECILDGNTITGVSPDMQNNRRGSRGGIHIGSGCDEVTVRDNQIEDGAGQGIGLGSVNNDGVSLGGMRGLRIKRNRIRGMALSGIGVLGCRVQNGDGSPSPRTDEILISANHIENCAYGEAEFLINAVTPIRLSGAVSLWMGDAMHLLDNEVVENGHLSEAVFAPHPAGGVFVTFASNGLVLSRNRIRNNFSIVREDPESTAFSNGGLAVLLSIATEASQPALTISDNDVDAPAGTAMFCVASRGALHISGNRLAGQMPPLFSVVGVVVEQGELLFNNNHVASRLLAPGSDSPVSLVGKHVTFSANHCVCQGELPGRSHVVIHCDSATATGNHCLEREPTDAVRSIRITGTRGAITAVANVTTNGVDLNPPNAANNLANVVGIRA